MNTLNKSARFTGAFLLFVLFSSPLYAVPITVISVGADWTNVQDTSGTVSYFDTDGLAGNEEIRWGAPASTEGQSGYRFDGSAPASFEVYAGDVFSLGDFSHTNQPVWGSITGAQLDINMDLSIGGVMLSEEPFSFSFLHNETDNGCTPLPECANDLVSFASLTSSDSFIVDGIEYTLELIGFSVDGVVTTEFSTLEGQINTAQLLGSFTATDVPAPSAALLLAMGLIVIGLSRKFHYT